MIWFLRLFFGVVLGSMLWVTTWAGLQVSLFDIPRSVGGHPWFFATLFDTYWAFLTFYLWLAYKEPAWFLRALWLIAVLLLGNIAMAVYCLIQLCCVPTDTKVETVLLRSDRPVAWWVPAGLLGIGGAIAWVA